MIGGGHSFSPLVATYGLLLTLDRYQGLVRADPATGLVTLRGGTRLWSVAELLAPHGLALETMGDIDRQSIAGAIQTGTHGTGARLTGFAGTVRALRIALPGGSVLDTSPTQDRDLFEAARLGLGTIGVILEVTLQCVPAYRLELVETTRSLDEAAGEFLATCERADHHEIFWFPRTDRATVRTMARLPADAPRQRPPRAAELLQREVLGNGAWEMLCRAAALAPPLSRPVADLASHVFAGPRTVDDSAAVYAAPRRVRFHESEWALPAEHLEPALAALRARFTAEDVRVTFPPRDPPGRGRRSLALHRVRAGDRVHRRAPLPPRGGRALPAARPAHPRRLRGEAPLGQDARAGRPRALPALPALRGLPRRAPRRGPGRPAHDACAAPSARGVTRRCRGGPVEEGEASVLRAVAPILTRAD